MDIIAQNPYRVLGMYANDSLKVMTANIARIRAYLKVGKKCEFDCDFTDIFGPIDRSEEAVAKAIESLSDDNNGEIHKLLWINRTETLNDSIHSITDILHSCNGDVDSASIINILVCALWTENAPLIVSSLVNLLDTGRSISNSNASRLIRIIIKDSGVASLQKFWGEYKHYSEKQKRKGNDTHTLICSEINALAINKLRNDILVNVLVTSRPKWKNLKIIHKWSNEIISILKESSNTDTSVPNAESQIAISEFSKVMLGACQRYYSEIHLRLVSEAEEFLSLLREIYMTVYDSTVKEQCSEFGKRVKSQQKFLAPDSMASQSATIQSQIDDFCEKRDEVKWSLLLVRNCAQTLLEIKNELGVDDLFYRRISTQIADNALYSADIELSSALRKFNNPANDKDVALSYLKHVIKNCGILISDIYQLDLESDFESSKASPFLKRVADLIQKHGIADNDTKADISLTTDAEKIAECGNDYVALKNFVLNNPNSPNIKKAMEKIWAIEDNEFPTNATAKDLLNYKQKFPNSHNEQKILNLLNQILLGATLGSIFEYRRMLTLWPNHPKKAIIEGRIDLINFKNCCCIGDWVAYLKDFPNGQHRNEAQKCIETEKFNECKTITDFNNFILKYPASEFYDAARAKIEDYVFLNAKQNDNYENYLRQYPNGKYANQAHLAIEDKSYQSAISKNDFATYLKLYANGRYVQAVKSAQDDYEFKKCSTIADYKRYLHDFPNGKHKKDADDKLTARRKKIFAVCGFAIITIIGLICLAIPKSDETTKSSPDVNKTVVPSASNDENIEYSSPQSQDNMYYQGEGSYSNSYSNISTDSEHIDNSLNTGSRPYKSYFGRSLSGGHQMSFKTDSGNDYVVIVKRHSSGKYVDHIYIKGGDYASINLPDGTFDVFFYSGTGWDPDKKNGDCNGGFVENEALQKDGPITLQRRYDGDYYYDQTLSYTLYPVYNGNLALQGASKDEAF